MPESKSGALPLGDAPAMGGSIAADSENRNGIALVLGAFHVSTIGCFHDNARTCGNMRWHHGAKAV
jgi:hypothetical protein